MPEISISLPVYNGERYIGQAIESALSQTFSDFELLVSDDCSTDATADIVQSYAARDGRITYWRNEKNLGLFANYNQAQSRARGRYIKPFAQDDIWDATILQKMHACFGRNENIVLVSVARRWITADGVDLPTYTQFREDTLIDGRAVLKDSLLRLVNWIGEPSTVMYPKWVAGTGFDPSYYHLGDLDYWLRIVEHGSFFYLSEPLCNFRRHEGSTTNKNLKGLLFATDMLLLGERFRCFLDDIGVTQREFAFNAVSNVSTYANHLTNRDEMSLEELLSIQPNSNEDAHSQLRQFKALAYFALLALAEERASSSVKLAQAIAERHIVEEDLSNVLNSTWWTSTEPLRQVARKFRQ